MKTKMKVTLALLALGASALAASAQDDGDRPPMNGHCPPPLPLVTALDANHDGVIDASEIANASTALLKLDQNGDGKLGADELKPQMPAGGNGQQFTPPDGGKFPTLPIMKALDTNGDSQLTREEIMPKFQGGFGGPGGTPPDDQ
jgi:hypothetical protein